MSLIDQIAITVAKLATFFIKIFHLGAGATWPGEIALKLRPNLLRVFSQQPVTIILVAGTNGKTTTVKMLDTILKSSLMKVSHNESGANLENGLVADYIKDSGLNGRLRSKVFIFEVDEAVLSIVVPKLKPQIVVLLNLFRDQLDRYGEVDIIAEKWSQALSTMPAASRIIVNADDPALTYIASKLKINRSYFGLEDETLFLSNIQHATDTIYCPKCGQRLTFAGVYFSHLGIWTCGKCGLTHPDVNVTPADFSSPLEGVYNKYNTLAAALTAQAVNIPDDKIKSALLSFIPAFGRMEEVKYQGKKVKILLSKNPTGFNESLRTVINSKSVGPILLALNDRIPDGTDVSWIWDVDFELLKSQKLNDLQSPAGQIFVSGDRCYDMGLRLKYAGLIPSKNFDIQPDLSVALNSAVYKTNSNETLWILATYSAMLDIRKILTGRKIL